jgi:hypothetical protein
MPLVISQTSQVINGFFPCTVLEEVVSQARDCFSLYRMEILASVEKIAGFSHFTGLDETYFTATNGFWFQDSFIMRQIQTTVSVKLSKCMPLLV